MRPAHGFTLQAISTQGATATEVGRRLGVSKQAAAKTVDRLVALRYVQRRDNDEDRRQKTVQLTERGYDAPYRSALIFDRIREAWAESLGLERVRAIESDLRRMAPASASTWPAGGPLVLQSERQHTQPPSSRRASRKQ